MSDCTVTVGHYCCIKFLVFGHVGLARDKTGGLILCTVYFNIYKS